MEIDLYALFKSTPALVFFVVIGFGYFLGKVSIRGFELGATGGVLLIGLLFGHFGFEGEPLLGTIGFTIFIYSVGMQAGPRFFNVLREDGRKYITLALVVAVSSLLMLHLLATAFGLDNSLSAGILAGALTSTPTLVGAQDAIQSGMARIPDGIDPGDVLRNVTVGYALTYLIGTVMIILLVRYPDVADSLPLHLYLPIFMFVLALLMISTIRFPKMMKRESKVFNAFQGLNVVVTYYCGITRSFPELLFFMAVLILISGIIAGTIIALVAIGLSRIRSIAVAREKEATKREIAALPRMLRNCCSSGW